MADMAARESQVEVALTFLQAAAVKFAQRGLLAQSLLCCRRMLILRPTDGVRANVMALSTMINRSDAEVAKLFFPGEGPLKDLFTELFSGTTSDRTQPQTVTPLLSYVGPEAFATLAELAPLRVFDEGATIVREGEAGETMYLVGMGRVLVYAADANGSRVYLSSMSAGDFFGENSFFTQAPRSATVEAVEHVEAFEIDQSLYDTLMKQTPQASAVLLQFYKERIVDALLAKSPVFGLLPPEARRALVAKFNLREFAPASVVIEEGDPSNNIFLIKNGHAEVSTSKGGPRTHLSTIGPGSLFGEVAAVRHIRRTAQVMAKTPLETLELTGIEFDEVLAKWPEVRQRVMDVLAQRARDNIDKLLGPSPFARFRV
jgi:CRP-like cAMP-binding protein